MVKILKIKGKEYSVSKEMISKFGEIVYHSKGVDSVFIKVNFSDGSNIGFRRSEGEDEMEGFFLKGKGDGDDE